MNHNLRENAAQDAEFVEKLCRDRRVKCFVLCADVAGYAAQKGISEELAGREIRYAFFHKLRKKLNITKIATAHNKNDAAESTLIHFIRGSGLGGLCGIPYARTDGVVRPLLDVEKAEIEAYCEQRNLDYVVDETNFEQKYVRNKVRLAVLPEIQRINPNFVDNITKNAQILADDEKFLNAAAQEAYNKAVQDLRLNIEILKTLDIALRRRVVQMLYRNWRKSPENLQAVHVEAVLALAERGKTGSRIELPKKINALIEYGKLFFVEWSVYNNYDIPILIGQKTDIPGIGLQIMVSPCEMPAKSTRTRICCALPERENLHIRTRQPGDFFYPEGMEGRKKLSDYFTDLKIPRMDRDKIPLLFCGEELVWVIGYRQDRRFGAKKDKKKIYTVEIFSKI